MSIAVKVENISKRYILKHSQSINNMDFRESIVNSIKSLFLKSVADTTEEFWALKEINFEIQEGDRVGIIGRNGAGKSTLLKIISRIIEPDSGTISIKGRIASLLEVGTGFHPELTGRENIFMNGAILGMSRAEIKSNFDAIVDFSGVEKFIDTPVKRYSSGMYVRLAFAVAAHLKTEILILDEVLAVGDAEFQKKCLGKMEDVSKRDGRTILFVSHNMAAIQNLCKKSVLLSNGRVQVSGNTENIINDYLFVNKNNNTVLSEVKQRKGNGCFRFESGIVKELNSNIENMVESLSDIQIELKFDTQQLQKISSARIDIGINNYMGDRIAWLSSDTVGHKLNLSTGSVCFVINKFPLAPGDYNCNLNCEINNELADWLAGVLKFSVVEKDYYRTGKTIPSNQGNILLDYSIKEK